MNYLDQLNPSQRVAVEQTDGPMLVIAGAGSGKTRVLTYKIAHLLNTGVAAHNILALTFTNKAAREMRERVYSLVGEQIARSLWMGTFHSICARILRQESAAIGYSHDYTIYDSADSKSMVKQIIKEMELDDKVYKAAVVLSRISAAKNALISPIDYASNRNLIKEDATARLHRLADIYFTYNKRLRQANAMDFDDLLFNTNLLLSNHADIRAKWQQVFTHILVDEYQDTNHSQYRIVQMLALPQNNICVVGDDAQSIYAFRGADIGNILHFQEQYPTAKLYKLERNYRSTQNIVEAAGSLISKNQNQIPKRVYSERDRGDLLQLWTHQTDREEAAFIARAILRLRRDNDLSFDDFATLYRNNAQSRVLEDELRKAQIPYKIYGGVSFYQRKEIKDALAYFRLAVNRQDDESLIRIINYPARGIGDTTLKKVIDTAHAADVSAFVVVSEPERFALNVSTATSNKLRKFAMLIQEFGEQAASMTAYEYANKVLRDSMIMQAALLDTTAEGNERHENLQELLTSIHEFEQDMLNQTGNAVHINDFLSEVSLLTDQDERLKDNTPRVSLMTIHSAKGLEFPVVFIAGMEENLFPSMYAESLREIEEERRLFYVAITRAELLCILTSARSRFRNGQTMLSQESRFVRDISEKYIKRHEQTPSIAPQWSSNRWGRGSERGNYYQNQDWNNQDWQSAPAPYTSKPATKSSRLRPTTGEQIKQDKTDIQTEYQEGSRVAHGVFGQGTVMRTYRENGNDKIEIRFDKMGTKTLLLRFAKLSII